MPKVEGVYRAANGSWYFKATVGRDPLTGTRIRVTKRGFATATEAARSRRELLEDVDNGVAPVAAGSLTVNELLDLYLDAIDADERLSPKTRYDYRRNADAYVRHQGIGSTPTSRWLFPGHLAGRPITALRLGQRLTAYGIDARAARRAVKPKPRKSPPSQPVTPTLARPSAPTTAAPTSTSTPPMSWSPSSPGAGLPWSA